MKLLFILILILIDMSLKCLIGHINDFNIIWKDSLKFIIASIIVIFLMIIVMTYKISK